SLAVPWAGGQSGFAGETPVIQGHPNSVLIQGHPGHGATPAPVPVYALAECLHLALERQPAIAAQRASLGAAQNASQAVENLRIPTLIARELPYRRQQACLGVTIAAAALDQVERETVYAVTRTYFTVLFARAQERVAQDTVANFQAILESARRQVEAGSRDLGTSVGDKISVYLLLAERSKAQASQGVERALAALKEAIGLAPDCCLQVPSSPLPEPVAHPCRHDIIAWALARRGEMTQATTLAEITHLEVDAQGTSCRPKMETFAAAGDIHSRQGPPGVSNTDYRPGAIPPEMPDTLVGSRSARMERARALSARASALTDKTRNLIALEADDTFLKWQEYAHQVPQTRTAASLADKLATNTRNDFVNRLKVKFEDVLTNQVLAAQARVQHNEALYRQILALAALERVTAGGFCAGLADLPAGAPNSIQTNGRAPSINGPNLRFPN